MRMSFGRKTEFVGEGWRIWIVGSKQLDMVALLLFESIDIFSDLSIRRYVVSSGSSDGDLIGEGGGGTSIARVGSSYPNRSDHNCGGIMSAYMASL